MIISKIGAILNLNLDLPNPDEDIHHLVYDSRRASGSKDELFFALKGKNRDGHQFIPALYDLGVRSFLVSDRFDTSPFPRANFLKVPNPLIALQQIAAVIRSEFNGEVVGITGSNGKTIVKEWLSTIIDHDKKVLKSPKSYNSQLGVPISIWPLSDEFEVAVLEAGISTSGEMEKLEFLIQPHIGIFTNIGEAHAEGFSSFEEKIQEKATLFINSQVVIYRKSHEKIGRELAKKGIRTIAWEINEPKADLNIQKEKDKISFQFENRAYHLSLPFSSAFDIENISHAIVCSIVLGMENDTIQHAINKLKPIPMRLELKKGRNNSYLLDDSYNNDLIGLEIALDYLLQQPHKSKKTVVLSDILQSGKNPAELYFKVNQLLEKHQVTRLIGIGEEIVAKKNLFSMEFEGFQSAKAFLLNAPEFAEELILVKGARDFELERVVSYLEERNHDTVLEVNFESILHNLNVYRSYLVKPTKLMVMVKAFAYGVGVEEIAHLLQYHQVDYLGVAYLDEAINLRKKGIQTPIMIMNVEWNSFRLLESFDLEPEIYSLPMIHKFLEEASDPPPIHLKIETGMNRLGFTKADIPDLISILRSNQQLKIAGIFTHFSSADMVEEDDYTRQQAEIFDEVYEEIVKAIGYRPIKHAVNSAGLVRWPQYHFDMVRLGIGLYGYDSTGLIKDLKPISTLKTVISQVKKVNAGETIGYSRKGKAGITSEIATIAIGYADGYSRAFSNGKAQVLVNGKLAPTIGNVCMDMTMIDVTGLNAQAGDEVIVFGENPTIEDLANWSDTIPYEILTNVSQRVKRVFVSE